MSAEAGLSLGYIIAESASPDNWASLGREILGAEVSSLAGGLAIRLDDRAQRILVQKGPSEGLAAIGWEAQDRVAFDRIQERLRQKKLQAGRVDLRRAFNSPD